jgi:hypothetical protein
MKQDGGLFMQQSKAVESLSFGRSLVDSFSFNSTRKKTNADVTIDSAGIHYVSDLDPMKLGGPQETSLHAFRQLLLRMSQSPAGEAHFKQEGGRSGSNMDYQVPERLLW